MPFPALLLAAAREGVEIACLIVFCAGMLALAVVFGS